MTSIVENNSRAVLARRRRGGFGPPRSV